MSGLATWLAAPRGAWPIPADSPPPAALLCGSFDPLHDGHRGLARAAGRHLLAPVHFELSVINVDKPPLAAESVARRAAQFADFTPLWLTAAPTFLEKSALFPGCAFVLGHDTALRLIDSRYAGGTEAGRDRVLGQLLAAGARFVVGGRLDSVGRFRTWEWGGPFAELFVALTEADFRRDVSSTALREAQQQCHR